MCKNEIEQKSGEVDRDSQLFQRTGVKQKSRSCSRDPKAAEAAKVSRKRKEAVIITSAEVGEREINESEHEHDAP